MYNKMSILAAIDDLNPEELLCCTKELKDNVKKTGNLFHLVIDSFCQKFDLYEQAVRIVYILSNYGHNINGTDNNGCTPLLKYLLNCDTIHNDFMEAMLRCNANVFYKNEDDVCAFAEARKPHISRTTKEVFARYMPGIWKAVASDDIHRVRFLVNQWCRVNVEKDGKRLVQLALEKGTENIISIVSGIRPSMDLAHGVLAGDLKFVESVIAAGGTVNINLKNMGDGGVTPIYYAALQNNQNLIELLLQNGARVHCSVVVDEGVEMSLYFALMKRYPQVTTTTLKHLLPVTPVHVEQLHYRGANVLFHCIDCNVSTELLSAILDVSSAALVTARQQDGLTPREYALEAGCDALAMVIDQYVYRWWTDNKPNSRNRQILALHSYQYIPKAIMPSFDSGFDESVNDPSCSKCDNGCEYLEQYKAWICRFHQAIEDEDLDAVETYLYFSEGDWFDPCIANSRQQGDCQPPLHKAVLRRNEGIVRLLAETLVYQQSCKLDSICDRFYRTALHYAYGMTDAKEIVDILEDNGSSEFVMDKDGRSPMMFKDRRDVPEMLDLLQYHLTQDFSEPEPDAWSVPLPIPIIGYIMNCANSRNHLLSNNLVHQLHLKPSPHDHHDLKTILANKGPKGKCKFLKSKSTDQINVRSSSLTVKFRPSFSKGQQKRPVTISEFADITHKDAYRRRSANDVNLVRPRDLFGKFRKSKEYIATEDKKHKVKICEDRKELGSEDIDNLEERLRRHSHSTHAVCVLL